MALEFRGVIPEAHDGQILAVAYSRNHRQFFTGSSDSLIKCWETETGRLVRSLAGHKGWVTDLLYLPEYQNLLSCSIDGRILAWWLKPGNTQSKNEVIKPLPLIEDADVGTPIQCMTWIERRKTLITSTDGSINLFELSSKSDSQGRRISLKFMQRVRLQNDLIRQLMVVEDCKIFAAGYDKRIACYTLGENLEPDEAGAPSRVSYIGHASAGGHTGAIAGLAYDCHMNRIISAGYDRAVKVWSVDGRLLQNFDGFAAALTGCCYCEVTRTLWAAAGGPKPLVHDMHSGTNISDIVQTRPENLPPMSIQKLWYFAETKDVVAVSATRQLLYWRFNPASSTRVIQGAEAWIEALACTDPPAPEIPELFSAGMDRKIKKWELGTRFNPDAIYCNDEYNGHAATILCIAFSAAHELICTGAEDGVIRVWQYATGQARLDIDTSVKYELAGVDGHTGRVTSLAVADHMLISVSWDQTVRFWDILTGHQAPYLLEEAHDDYIWDVAYCAASDTFATASADKTIKVWSMATRALLGTLRGHTGEVFKVEWNPTHALWVSGGEDATVRTWAPVADGPQPAWAPTPKPAPEEGEPQPAAEGEEAESEEEETAPDPLSLLNTISSREPVTALCLDKNSGYAVVATMDHYIRVYDLLACEVVATHTGHADSIRSIIHVPAKNEYVSCSWDQTIRVWKAAPPPKAIAPPPQGAEAAAKAAALPEEQGEPEQPSYADLHPMVMPKTMREDLIKGGKTGGARPAPNAEIKKKPAKKVVEAAPMASPVPPQPTTRVALRLDQLEADLKQADQLVLGLGQGSESS